MCVRVCTCVRACVRVCEYFPDVVDLLTLDFEIQALFWIFHRVQAVYYQLVVINGPLRELHEVKYIEKYSISRLEYTSINNTIYY